ncbi:MAG: NrdH-redoxin [Cryobacterium sp.]|uniref:glutaredoxin family protein n=1 Tax=unclassified Cryobacterium TaxID=2649013 RepID=UPI0018C8DEC4|nr:MULTISPECIES: glutaredoxin domain-containing protein [unclassified Cryobacterium]MCY7403264.1 NrdH-redoxin [Cryobacterium sp.]MEC5153662.1 mycoredoxin [Cryobacterium sp. CAN_C3]
MTETTATAPRITMYGAEWCGDCRRSKSLLDRLEVDYHYVDLLLVEDGADRARAISGRTNIPVIVFPDDTHMVEPSDAEVRTKLTQLGRIS